MSSKITVAFAISIIFSVAFKGVLSWTIDLTEARKFYFDKYSKNTNNENVNAAKIEEDKKFYDNIYPNSPYHEDYEPKMHDYEERTHHDVDYVDNDIYHGKYADDYDYQSYMEKKVHGIVHNGSVYLEGLRKALDRYSELLRNCSEMEDREPTTNSTWLPENELPSPTASNSTRATCERATRSSEHVRRLAELALWATRELQDRAYAEKYQGQDRDEEEEEKELLLRLAWFLDRLASLTGFEPNPKDFITDAPAVVTTPSSTTSPSPTTKECDPSNTDNCQYPLSMPESTTTTTSVSTVIESQGGQPTTTTASSSAEVLTPSETKHLPNIPPKLTAVRSVRKRSIHDNPLLHVVKYYTKHKVWVNSNLGSEISEESTDFNVPNDLVAKTIQKRAIDNKKSKHLQLPEDPMKDISSYSKHKPGLHYIKDKAQAEKIREFLKKIHIHSLHLKPEKKSVQKRSTHYEKMFLPSISQNPQQDLSYYAKARKGTNARLNLVEALQVRAGLEQVFQTGNIEVVRRYGANYNPAVVSPLLAGSLQTFTDS